MNPSKQHDLLTTIAGLQRQHGNDIVTKGKKSKAPTFIPTGFTELDLLLDGGIQRGRLTHLMGNPTSGMTTLALKIMSNVQRSGEEVVYIDLAAALDPNYAILVGIDPAQLLMLRLDFDTVLSALFDVVKSRTAGGVILNANQTVLSNAQKQKLLVVLERLYADLSSSNCALLLLTHLLSDKALSQYATLCLKLELSDWTQLRSTVQYQGRITILKYKGSNEGKTTQVTIKVAGQPT